MLLIIMMTTTTTMTKGGLLLVQLGGEAADVQVRAGEDVAVPRDRSLSSGAERSWRGQRVWREVARGRHRRRRRVVATERQRAHCPVIRSAIKLSVDLVVSAFAHKVVNW